MELIQAIRLGNRCGHDPSNPQWFTKPSQHKSRMDVLIWAQANIQQFYSQPTQWLKSLRLTRQSKRQQRSEARERDGKIIQILLHHVELASLRVGTPNEDGTFVSLSMRDLAKRAGWRSADDDEQDKERVANGQAPKNKGIKRVWRALDNLRKAGYISVHQRFEVALKADSGEKDYKGLPAVKCLLPKLFKELGITLQRLRLRREQAAKRLKQKYQLYVANVEKALKKVSAISNVRISKLKSVFHFIQGGKGSAKKKSSCLNNFEKQEKALLLYELRQLPENQQLTAEAFYSKYPELKPRA